MIKNETSELLDSKLVDFFPKEGNWKSNCFRREKCISETNLPCHLRDEDWLTSLIMKKYDLYSLGKGVIKEYVRDSEYFNRMRHDYEQRIVKWQIKWMQSGGGNWIVESGNDEFLLSKNCDCIFRKGIVDTLLAIGIDINAIEEGIEKNVNTWLDPLMTIAFDNIFNLMFSSFRIPLSDNESENDYDEKLKDADLTFKNSWLKYRKWQYYQEHKESIELYGIVTPEMKMSTEEVKYLEKYLKEQEKIRLEEIENFRKRKNYGGISKLKEMSESDFYSLSYEDCIPINKKNKTKSLIKNLKELIIKK